MHKGRPRPSLAKLRLTKFNEQGRREALDLVLELGALQEEHLVFAALVAYDFSGMPDGSRVVMKVGLRVRGLARLAQHPLIFAKDCGGCRLVMNPLCFGFSQAQARPSPERLLARPCLCCAGGGGDAEPGGAGPLLRQPRLPAHL